ncbi:DUF4386 domain-containing protein [Aquimarina rubra]|uniref:DUF4386 domain-containing protein n=1 Tax=Aquimarina rubra TaxID=1920033 RepID=A0ABW5LIU7_9FLAO
MEPTKKNTRITGLIGIIVLVSGSFTHSVNSKLISYEDKFATANNFINYESLFRIGFISSLIMETVFIFYAFNLYRILKPVNKNLSMIMLILALIPVPLFMLNQLNQFDAFLLANNDIEEMMFFLTVHKHGGLIVSIFFGLWLFPLGLLIYQSKYLPKILGIFLMVGCFGYLIHFFQGFLIPNFESSLWTNPFLIITHISELLLMLWLLIKGLNIEKWKKVTEI